MFSVALFTRAKLRKQPKCPLICKQINKMVYCMCACIYIYTRTYVKFTSDRERWPCEMSSAKYAMPQETLIGQRQTCEPTQDQSGSFCEG